MEYIVSTNERLKILSQLQQMIQSNDSRLQTSSKVTVNSKLQVMAPTATSDSSYNYKVIQSDSSLQP